MENASSVPERLIVIFQRLRVDSNQQEQRQNSDNRGSVTESGQSPSACEPRLVDVVFGDFLDQRRTTHVQEAGGLGNDAV